MHKQIELKMEMGNHFFLNIENNRYNLPYKDP